MHPIFWVGYFGVSGVLKQIKVQQELGLCDFQDTGKGFESEAEVGSGWGRGLQYS